MHFQPLLLAIQRKLQGWKTKFLSLAGRLTLVKSVISAMSLHIMQVIKLPQWLIEAVDRLRRNFLWREDRNCLGGHCLVNWSKCCLLKQNGGLGILNLKTQNEALLAKWVWSLLTQPDSDWAVTLRGIYGTSDVVQLSQHPLLSTQLGDILNTFRLFQFSLTQQPDGSVRWNWVADGIYKVSAAYRLMAHTGIIVPFHTILWKIKAPPKVKTFLWLLLLNRLLTQANLILRGWPSQSSCALCQAQLVEDSDHLFRSCHFSSNIWLVVGLQFNITLTVGANSLEQFWMDNRRVLNQDKRRLWDVVWSATCWTLWKQRCRVIFQDDVPTLHKVLFEIELQVRNWSSLGPRLLAS